MKREIVTDKPGQIAHKTASKKDKLTTKNKIHRQRDTQIAIEEERDKVR